jgi:hypothetical protein
VHQSIVLKNALKHQSSGPIVSPIKSYGTGDRHIWDFRVDCGTVAFRHYVTQMRYRYPFLYYSRTSHPKPFPVWPDLLDIVRLWAPHTTQIAPGEGCILPMYTGKNSHNEELPACSRLCKWEKKKTIYVSRKLGGARTGEERRTRRTYSDPACPYWITSWSTILINQYSLVSLPAYVTKWKELVSELDQVTHQVLLEILQVNFQSGWLASD